jgi:formamidopyrimidine-DNA glycosylase
MQHCTLMPELPEVEVVRRGLVSHLPGDTVQAVSVLHPRAIRRQIGGPRAFSTEISGARFHTVSRRGKYLWAVISPEPHRSYRALVMHLGMSGQLLLRSAQAAQHVHARVHLALAGDQDLWFIDQRTFGGLYVDDLVAATSADDEHLPASIAHIARDPLDPRFDDDAFSRSLRRRHSGIKRALLDQALISGIGNIYADEALWRSAVHYERSCAALRKGDVQELLTHVRDVMSAALDEGGTSFDALYVNVNGQSGYFDRSLDAYGRSGEPCSRCGALIVREAFMNRSSFRCPTCQRRPRSIG